MDAMELERAKLRADYKRVRSFLRREQELRLRYWNPHKAEESAAEIAVVLAALRRLGEAVRLEMDEAGRSAERVKPAPPVRPAPDNETEFGR